MPEEYEIGYGKPPQHTRFKRGYSGHPEGRPKGATNVKTEMKRLLAAKTTIKVGGAVQKVTTSKAMCMALVQKALKGTCAPSPLDLLHRAFNRREGETNSAQAPSTVEPPARAISHDRRSLNPC